MLPSKTLMNLITVSAWRSSSLTRKRQPCAEEIIHPSFHWHVHSFTNSSIRSSTHPSMYPHIDQSVPPSVHPSIHPAIAAPAERRRRREVAAEADSGWMVFYHHQHSGDGQFGVDYQSIVPVFSLCRPHIHLEFLKVILFSFFSQTKGRKSSIDPWNSSCSPSFILLQCCCFFLALLNNISAVSFLFENEGCSLHFDEFFSVCRAEGEKI